MRCCQAITTPFANRPVQPNPKAAVRKCNLVPLTRPNRAKLSQHRWVNVGPLPEATQQNWASTLGKADDAAGMITSLAPIQGSYLMDTSSMASPISPVAHAIITEHSKYCVICTPLGKICLEEFAMSLDWDNDEDQAKNNNKDNNQNHSQNQPSFSTVMTITLMTTKPFINKYFDSMSSETPIVYTPKIKCLHDTITVQQELNTIKCKVQNQDSLEELD